jgi:hypothetical protein
VYEKRYIAGANTVRSTFAIKDSGKRMRRKGSLMKVKSCEKRPDQLNEKNQLKTVTMMLKARIKGDIVGDGWSEEVAATIVDVGSDGSAIFRGDKRGC